MKKKKTPKKKKSKAALTTRKQQKKNRIKQNEMQEKHLAYSSCLSTNLFLLLFTKYVHIRKHKNRMQTFFLLLCLCNMYSHLVSKATTNIPLKKDNNGKKVEKQIHKFEASLTQMTV